MNISINPDAEYVEELRQQARESGNELALAALGVVDALVAGRRAIYNHYEKERGLRIQYHGALTRSLHWASPEGRKKNKRSLTKDDVMGIMNNMLVEIKTGLGEMSDFEVTA